jgi:hypothetical protein
MEGICLALFSLDLVLSTPRDNGCLTTEAGPFTGELGWAALEPAMDLEGKWRLSDDRFLSTPRFVGDFRTESVDAVPLGGECEMTDPESAAAMGFSQSGIPFTFRSLTSGSRPPP